LPDADRRQPTHCGHRDRLRDHISKSNEEGETEMNKSIWLLTGLALFNLEATQAIAQPAHQPLARVGQCVSTRITRMGARLEGDTSYENGMYFSTAAGVGGVDYGPVPGLSRSRVGDRVRTCLVSIPRGCPPGDDRGRIYRTTNRRTHQSWRMSDSQHGCGGA
jgi:hypothetical protein